MIKKLKQISIVLISYNSSTKLIRFIKKIPKNSPILIIDNSKDFNLKKIFKKNKNIKIYFKKNMGYGSSINYAAKKINTKYFFVVQPDVKGINKKTKAIIIPNLLGNVPDWKQIKNISKKYNLKIIEDSADTIGYKLNNKNFGKYSDISTNSMYASHIITGAGFGGMVCFNDKKLYERAKLLRGWGRSSAVFNESEGINKRFNTKVDGIPYDGKYIFHDIGYNFLPSEISAAFALEQLKKLPKNINIRIKNFEKLKVFFNNYPHLFELPNQLKGLKTPWLAYPIILRDKSGINRQKLQIFLEKKGIQTRTIFTGNILRQPIMKKKFYKKVKNAEINSNNIMKNGILIGCHHGLGNKDINYIIKNLKIFIKRIID